MSDASENRQGVRNPRTSLGTVVNNALGVMFIAGAGAAAVMPISGRGPGDRWELLGKAVSVAACFGAGAALMWRDRVGHEQENSPMNAQR